MLATRVWRPRFRTGAPDTRRTCDLLSSEAGAYESCCAAVSTTEFCVWTYRRADFQARDSDVPEFDVAHLGELTQRLEPLPFGKIVAECLPKHSDKPMRGTPDPPNAPPRGAHHLPNDLSSS